MSAAIGTGFAAGRDPAHPVMAVARTTSAHAALLANVISIFGIFGTTNL
jgi:hypothetical protein